MDTLKRLEQAVYDNREGKPLNLIEQEYELFYMIFNDGKNQFEPVELEALGEQEIENIVASAPTFVEGDRPGGYVGTRLYKNEEAIRKTISQATVCKNQTKGPLFRLKE